LHSLQSIAEYPAKKSRKSLIIARLALKCKPNQTEMGAGQSQFSIEELCDYEDLTYFSKKEILL